MQRYTISDVLLVVKNKKYGCLLFDDDLFYNVMMVF